MELLTKFLVVIFLAIIIIVGIYFGIPSTQPVFNQVIQGNTAKQQSIFTEANVILNREGRLYSPMGSVYLTINPAGNVLVYTIGTSGRPDILSTSSWGKSTCSYKKSPLDNQIQTTDANGNTNIVTNSVSSQVSKLIFNSQSGLLALADQNNNIVWQAIYKPNLENAPFSFVVQDDTNCVIYDATNKPVWSAIFCNLSNPATP